jgi:two-component system sensor histidine kinase RegB
MRFSGLFSVLPVGNLLARLLALRVLLLSGWLAGIGWLHFGIGVLLPLTPMLGVLSLLGLLALITVWRLRVPVPTTRMEAFAHLLVDLTGFAVLVFFSGGATNPFVSLMLVPVVIAAISLPMSYVVTVAVLASLYYAGLLFNYVPLAIADPVAAYGMHLGGMWFNFVISAGLMAFFVVRIQSGLRAREQELTSLRERGLRDEKVLALGTQAALAAHELATPLATIAMTAEELVHVRRDDPGLAADCQRLREQALVCKGILNRLASQAREGHPVNPLPAKDWLSGVLDRWQLMRPQADLAYHPDSQLVGTCIAPPAEVEQALFNLFDNAADASDAPVEVGAYLQGDRLCIDVADRGPGFSAAARAQAGRVWFTGKSGLGLGLTLTHATIERLGGEVRLLPREGGGARVEVSLPLARLAV